MVLRLRLLVMLTALLVCRCVAQSNPPEQVQVSPDVSQGLLIDKVQPSYPPLARQARVQGPVVLHAVIGKDGLVQQLQVVSGHPMLIPAALDAVKQWRYKPYVLNGEPIVVQTTITVNFQLNGPPSEGPPNPPPASKASSEGGISDRPATSQGVQVATSEPNQGFYRIGGDVSAPKATYAPDPQYSAEARHAGYQGTVVLWLVVDADGLPQKIKVQRALGMGLDEEAIKTVKQWRFQPAMREGKPVPVAINIEVNFRLYGKGGKPLPIPPSPVAAAASDVSTLFANASSAHAMNDCATATPLAIRVTELSPQHNGAWNLLGMCYLELDELSKAEDALKQQIIVSPRSAFAYNNLGRVYARQREYDQAIAQFRKQIELNPRDRYAHMNLAESLRSAKKCDQAIPEYQFAAQLAPESAGPHVGLARCYFTQGKQDLGMAEVNTVAALVSSGLGWNAAARTLAEHNLQLDRAEKYARLAVSMESSSLSAVSLDPLTPGAYGRTNALAEAWDTLGWILDLSGDFNSAEKYLVAGWTLSRRPTSSDHLAQLAEKLGRKDDSIKYSVLTIATAETLSEAQDSDEDAVANSRERLTRLAPSSAASTQLSQEARLQLEQLDSFAVPNPAKHEGNAGFALLRPHGDNPAKARWMTGEPSLKDFTSEVAARMPAGPADIGAIDLLRWGSLTCQQPDTDCQFRLASAREAVYAQLRSAVTTSGVAGSPAVTEGSPQSIQVAQGVSEGLLIHRVQPSYPQAALDSDVQGTVALQAVIGKDGLIKNLQLISGHPLLAPSALAAVKQWRYKPYLLNGEPVEVRTLVTISFVLQH